MLSRGALRAPILFPRRPFTPNVSPPPARRNILEAVGNTPLVRLEKLPGAGAANVFVKCEAFNPMGSVKDRLAVGVIEWAEEHNELQPGQTVVEATSGNTGIGLAMVCAQKGYPFVCVMSESFSVERRKLMRFLGAKVVLTPAHLKGSGMIMKAKDLADHHGWFNTKQFQNEANAWIHEITTGPEIIQQLEGPLDYFVTGYGSGGTLRGVGRYLRKESPSTKIVVCEPDNAPLIYSGVGSKYDEDGLFVEPHPSWRPHLMQGWTPDFIPKLVADAIDDGVVYENRPISGNVAMEVSKNLARLEGIFTGVSGGATVAAALDLANELQATGPKDASPTIVAMLPDTGERYLSTPLFDDVPVEMTEEELEISKSTPLYRFDVQQAPPQAPPAPVTPEAMSFVEEQVAASPVVVFSLEYCEFCWSATKLMDDMKVPYTLVSVDALKLAKDNFGGSVRSALSERTGGLTFPQIIIDKEFVGGATDVFDQYNKGTFHEKLREAGVEFDEKFECNPYSYLPAWLAKR